jgi:hypothetical protein
MKTGLNHDESDCSEESDEISEAGAEVNSQDGSDDEEKNEKKEPINREDKPYKLGFSDYVLMRSKQPVEDVNI